MRTSCGQEAVCNPPINFNKKKKIFNVYITVRNMVIKFELY